MRGKVVRIVYAPQQLRITPAYAGKRNRLRPADDPAADHPRIRGEKFSFPAVRVALLGSPPHTRGKVNDFGQDGKGRRITPAYAGKRKRHPGAKVCP